MAHAVIRNPDDCYISYMFLNANNISLETGEGAFSLLGRRATHSQTIVSYFSSEEKQKETNEPGQNSKQLKNVLTACKEHRCRCSFVVAIGVRNTDVFHR